MRETASSLTPYTLLSSRVTQEASEAVSGYTGDALSQVDERGMLWLCWHEVRIMAAVRIL